LPGAEEAPNFYTLSPKSTFSQSLPEVSGQLVIEVPVTSEALDTHQIALGHGALLVDYYAHARWTERVPNLVQTLLLESFENTGKIVSVAREGSDLRADFALKTEIREFQAEYREANAPPTVRVRVIAKLIKRPARAIVASQSFEGEARSAGTDLPSVVTAYDEALGKVLKHLVEWALPKLVASP
jgi:cholesterol transport system auxiliary component